MWSVSKLYSTPCPTWGAMWQPSGPTFTLSRQGGAACQSPPNGGHFRPTPSGAQMPPARWSKNQGAQRERPSRPTVPARLALYPIRCGHRSGHPAILTFCDKPDQSWACDSCHAAPQSLPIQSDGPPNGQSPCHKIHSHSPNRNRRSHPCKDLEQQGCRHNIHTTEIVALILP